LLLRRSFIPSPKDPLKDKDTSFLFVTFTSIIYVFDICPSSFLNLQNADGETIRQEHLFIVTELLRANLYEFQKYNQESGDEVYFSLPRIQVFTTVL